MDISNYTPGECRARLEDVVKILDEIGVPEMDTPSQRVRALADMLEERVVASERVLDTAAKVQADTAQHQMLAQAAWFPFPDEELTPPTDRDVLVQTDEGKQVVVRFDPKPCVFITTHGTRVWINHVRFWRELVAGVIVKKEPQA